MTMEEEKAPRHNYKMVIAYEGTRYSGWQMQSNSQGIQGLVQQSASVAIKEPVKLIGAGRTDAGVHAMGQTANFICSSPIDLYRFVGNMNGLLPKDIRIKHVEEVPLSFHSRFSAISKTYHYHLSLGRVGNPFNRLYSWHLFVQPNLSLLKEAAALFVGTHDFTSFANEAHRGSASQCAIRNLQRLDVIDQEGGVRLEFQADGFLYKMVRNIMGTLIKISYGKLPIEIIPKLIAIKDRSKAGPAAPAHGLFLARVDYPSH